MAVCDHDWILVVMEDGCLVFLVCVLEGKEKGRTRVSWSSSGCGVVGAQLVKRLMASNGWVYRIVNLCHMSMRHNAAGNTYQD